MRIEKYNAERLRDFLESQDYREMPFLPVSQHRAQSWLHNPRLKQEDIILYIGFEDGDMVAYRSILPDNYQGNIHFGWLSGIWVRPDQRRKGIAAGLFEEAYKDWGHQLMYTNYAPEAKALLDKTGRFDLYAHRPGRRYYQRSSSASLLENRHSLFRRSRLLLNLADGLLNSFQDIRILSKREHAKDLNFIITDSPDYRAMDFLEKNQGRGFCNRSMDEFNWISKYPWIKGDEKKDTQYFFSSHSKRFQNICINLSTTV
jgi:GNAT superfamily N-acetyltransferase